MQDTQQGKSDPQGAKNNNRNPFRAAKLLFARLPVGLRWIVLGALAVFLLIVGIAVLHPSLNERWKFGTDMTLNLLILLAIAVQAYIYTEQRAVMKQQWTAMQDGLKRTDEVVEKMEAQSDILRKQAKSMDESVVFGLRAYVGVHSIGIDFLKNQIFLQVENIGKVPATEVKVDLEIEVAIPAKCMPEGYDISLGAYVFTSKTIPYHYGKAKLFPGNLNIKIIVPYKRWLSEELSDEQIMLIFQSHARLIVRGNINFCDGFNADKNTPFALRYSPKADCWLPYPILSPEEARKASEEQPYYEE